MALPQSEKLAREKAEGINPAAGLAAPVAVEPIDPTAPVRIREVPCLNDNVAILRSHTEVQGGIVLAEGMQHKNEGVVLGVGPGIPDGAGGRLPSQVKIGDVVSFLERNIILATSPQAGFYAGRQVVIISERSLLTKLPPVPVEIVEG